MSGELQDAPFAVAQRTLPAMREVFPDAPFAPKSEPAVPMVAGALKQHFESQARPAKSFTDYIEAGFQQSVTGLAVRGTVPDVALDETAPWYGRLASGVSGLAGDAPAMVGGALLGGGAGAETGPGAVVTGAAGAFALPAGLRAVMMDAYSRGEVASASEFIDRAMGIAWETGKGWLTGAATGGAGVLTKAVLPVAAPLAVKAVAPTAAEIATMTTVGRALEGQLPDPEDFMDAAILIAGLKGAGAAAGRLRRVYAVTGVKPEQVVADAARDPQLKAELAVEASAEVAGQLDLPGIPKAYQPAAQDAVGRAIVPGVKAEQVAASQFALELPQAQGEPAKPTHVNYNLITSPVETKLALARLSEVYEAEIQSQRRGTVSWDQTSAETAKLLSDTLGGVDTKLIMPREPGTAAGAAELLARKQMVVGAAEAMMAARDALLSKGANASMEDRLAFIASVERTAMIQSEFLGARAEAGRALNILKSTVMDAERVKAIQNVIDIYGKDPVKLAEMMKELDNPASALKFARDAVKATTWEKFVEAWKAAILSGPITQIRNIMGNTSFLAVRPFIDAGAAAFGVVRSGPDRVTAVEPIARVVGNFQGIIDGSRIAWATFKAETPDPGKVEQFRQANTGAIGAVVQVPFRFLQSADAFFKTVNERGEAYTLAVRQAAKEDLNPATREFRERVASIVQNPSKEMAAEIAAVGERFTFNKPFEAGSAGRTLQNLVRQTHTEWLFPFIRTPARILEETGRMTPLAPFLKSWREDLKAGGARADKAMAEVAVGGALMSYVFALALDGTITGAGEPDAGKRRIATAAGWQPYSIKIGNEYYNYQGIGPVTTLMGIAADAAAVWDHMNEEESDKIPKMLAVGFANAVTSQTALMGLTNIVNVTSDPTRYGPTFFKGMAGSIIPSIIAQPTAMVDPVAREVDSMLDAIKARIPGLRQTLLPKRDAFGEPIKGKERLLEVSPVTVTHETTDKVRSEAYRLGVSVADTPKKTHLGRGTGKTGDVELTPEERDRFAEIGGQLAHSVLATVVESSDWDELPDRVKTSIYRNVFTRAHKVAAAQALPMEKRLGLLQEITEKVQAELSPEPQ